MLLNTEILNQSWACDFAFYETAVVAMEATRSAAKSLGVTALFAIGAGHQESVDICIEDGFVVPVHFTEFH
jgi:hypothetical protein